MTVAKPTQPSLEAIPAWPYHLAILTPLYFDPYGPSTHKEAWNTRLAREKKAIEAAEQGFTHIKHIIHENKLMTPSTFAQSQKGPKKISGLAEIIN